MTWYDRAVEAIEVATKDLPSDTPLTERKKVVDAAYPFGLRENYPYKAWLKARRQYLLRYGWIPSNLPLSPMERMMQRATP